MNKDIIISTRSVLLVLAIIAGGFLLYWIRDVLFLLIISLVLVLALEPSIKAIVNHKIPRGLAVSVVYLVLIAFVIIFFTIALPLVLVQTRNLILNLPNIINTLVSSEDARVWLNESLTRFTPPASLPTDVLEATKEIFSNAFNIIFTFIFTLYLSLDLVNIKKRFLSFFADDLKSYIEDTVTDIEVNLGQWVKSQIFLMIVIGLVSYVGLILLRVPYAVSLAIVAGFLEVVPVLGPIIATVIAVIVAASVSPLMALLVLILFIGIQQLENGFLVPKVMQQIIGFNPLITMLALLIGNKLLGLTGAIIAIPIALIAVIVFHRLVSLDLES